MTNTKHQRWVKNDPCCIFVIIINQSHARWCGYSRPVVPQVFGVTGHKALAFMHFLRHSGPSCYQCYDHSSVGKHCISLKKVIQEKTISGRIIYSVNGGSAEMRQNNPIVLSKCVKDAMSVVGYPCRELVIP